jgi:membrane protein DedA with SNARE-associated domain
LCPVNNGQEIRSAAKPWQNPGHGPPPAAETILLSLSIRLAWYLPTWAQTPDWYRPLTRFVGRFIRDHQALGTFFVIAAEEIGIPLPAPGDVVIAVTGYLTTTGAIPFWAAFLAVVAGATIGSLGLFTAGRTFGRSFILRFGHYVGMTEERLDQAERLFRRYGPWAVIVGRHIPGMRIYLSALAGTFHMRYRVFVPCVMISSSIWALIFLMVGRVLGRQSYRLFRLIPAHLLPYAVAVIAVVALVWIALAHGWRPLGRRRRIPPARAAETPKGEVGLHKT